jgi:hypothetical protein
LPRRRIELTGGARVFEILAGFDRLPVDESLPLREPGKSGYGARKACERKAEAVLPGRVVTPAPASHTATSHP